jgi:EAL domain-containing protein (putative c-di-GMP-specific phosphodiesterase class I)
MEENKKKSTLTARLGIMALLLAMIFLIVYMLTVIVGSSSFFAESAEKNALLCFEEDIERAEALAQEHFDNLYGIADKVKNLDSREAVEAVMESYIGSEMFGDLRYYSGGSSYAANGALVVEETSAKEYISALSASNTEGCSPIYYDKHTELDCIAFFVPVRGSEHIDGILSVLPARNLVDVGEVINEKSSAVAIISKDGKVISETVAENFDKNIGNNFYTFINALTNNKSDSALISEAVLKGEKAARSIIAQEADYTVAIAPLSRFGNNLMLVSMSESEGLIAPELTYIRHIVNLLLISIFAIAVGMVYATLYHRRAKRALSAATLEDSRLECPNTEQFKLTAKELITVTRRKYSLALLSIRNFMYFNEQLGERDSTAVLREMAKIIGSLSKNQECYGYSGDGKFVLLILHANSHSVNDKIKLIETIINRNELLRERGMKIRFAAGVYNVFSGRRRSVQEMIDCATTACSFSEDNIKTTYTLFSEEVRAEIAHNEKIEAIMENALENRDFRLFLQPKYDVVHDVIDSAEALVRWFDPEKGEYKFPGEFIPLFETNGFVVKLDHFVYIEVLEYLSRAAEKGEKVIPIAVNVSRVTATSPDFINFYVGNKKKYGIPDNFITLELTESFAMEDYDKISTIINALHNSGICCSIDDFGSGYSSFSILKQINVDELKLDSVFLRRGVDVKRDDKLLSTMIELAKSMGMRVVQEGVETKEMFDKVVAMGCDVIQGYYYAKAISLEEFKLFINTNTSIKYKSLVK